MHFPTEAKKKNKKKLPWTKFLISQKIELCRSDLRKILYFLKWNPALFGLNHQNFSLKNFHSFSWKTCSVKNFYIFLYFQKCSRNNVRENNSNLSSRNKKSSPYILGNGIPEQIPYISENGTFASFLWKLVKL